jgi:GT2 family glycosyltransferase
VTWNGAADIAPCLEALDGQEGVELEIVVVDNASTDASVAEARSYRGRWPLQVLPQEENLGFAAGMNRAIAASSSPLVLCLNADTRPADDFIRRLAEALVEERSFPLGAATGRLTRPGGDGGTMTLDACGMRLTRTWRHLDRGSGEVDRGQFASVERVFGGTGAATLFLRRALDDVAVEGKIFDPLFHSFREDAELAFRLQERGWEALYVPQARCQHRRFNLPQRREAMSATVNRHSLKNRYLLRLYHQSAGNFLRTFLPTLGRDLLALGYVVVRERSSLGAYGWLWRHRRQILGKSRTIRRRRTVPWARVDRWFRRSGEPL